MTHIHYVESNTAHASDFVIDVPEGYHWLLVITKTPAQYGALLQATQKVDRRNAGIV